MQMIQDNSRPKKRAAVPKADVENPLRQNFDVLQL
jgi:hypothetical protein